MSQLVPSEESIVVTHIYGTILTICLLAHSVSLLITLSRVFLQVLQHRLRPDDVLATMSAIGVSVLIGVLLAIVSGDRQVMLSPVGYHISLSSYFVIIWFARASMTATAARCFQNKLITVRSLQALAILMMVLGVLFGILAAVMCRTGLCTNRSVCYCPQSDVLMSFTLTCDVFFEGIILMSNLHAVLTKSTVDATIPRKIILVLGFSGNVYTFISSYVFWSWSLGKTLRPQVLFILINTMAIIALLACNIPIMLAAAYRGLYGRLNIEPVSAAQNLSPPFEGHSDKTGGGKVLSL